MNTFAGRRISRELEIVRTEMALKYGVSKLESDKMIAKIVKNSALTFQIIKPKTGRKRRKSEYQYDEFSIF